MLKAVIFDMDGVIIDSEPLHAKAAVKALKRFGVDITEEYCYSFIGSTAKHMFEVIKAENNLTASIEEIMAANSAAKNELLTDEGYPVIPYVKELMINLYNNGIKLAIASSSPIEEINETIKRLDISTYLSAVVSGMQVKNPKPAPDIFRLTAELLETDASECVVIEDSFNGVTAAKAAGMTRIGFLNPHSGNQDLSQVNFVIEGFDEIDYLFIEQIYQRSKGLPVTISETDRLIIRELTTDDIRYIYNIYQSPEIKRYVDDIDEYLNTEIEKHKAYIKNVYSFYGYGYWGVFTKDNGKLIGRCGIQNNEIDDTVEIELGYLLDVKHWGNGYAYECAKSVLEYAFSRLGIPRIVAVIDKQNERSKNVAERLGMTVEKEIFHKGRYCLLYTITNL